MATPSLIPCRHFIDGQWRSDAGGSSNPVFNPSRGEIIAEVPAASAALVEETVAAATAAQRKWRQVPVVERVRYLFRYRSLLEEHFDEICRITSREHGKTLAEARGELHRGIECVEYACGAPELMKGECLEDIASQIDCEVIRQPLGVCVGITPFNFPAMIPLWMFPMALACGNAFILKPSEKTPLTATKLTELLEKTQLPQGVFSMLHGGRETVDALLVSKDVKAVSFVGSSPVAKYIHETASRTGKRVQANGGAKNHAILMPDADPLKAISGIIAGAYGCAGERCMAIASIIAVGDARTTILPKLIEAVKAIKTGPTDGNTQPEMGPLITRQHCERVAELVGMSAENGGRITVDGRAIRIADAPTGFFHGPTVIERLTLESPLASTEVFGPVLGVMEAATLDEAIGLTNRSPFGNGTAIFTTSGHHARAFKHQVDVGMVGINVPVPAPMAMFPFSGWKSSFYGHTHIQGRDAARFYTQSKTVTTRWFGEADVWKR